MLSKFFNILYLRVFVNIVVGHSKTMVYIEVLNHKNKVVDYDHDSFNTIQLNSEMFQYIENAIKESPFYYISVLDNSVSQGAIPTCDKHKLEDFHDLSDSEYRCYKNKWIYYTDKGDIYNIEKKFQSLGLDFIFSPYVVLANFFKDKIDTHLAMFILLEESLITLSVFNKSELLYAEHFDISSEFDNDVLSIDESNDDSEDIDLDLDDEESIDLDSIDALDDMDELDDMDDMDELDDFGDIADLDSIEDIDEFSEGKDLDEELFEEAEEEEEKTPNENNNAFSKDYQRFSLIQSSISHFYKDERFNSEFIENVYIADSVGVSPDFKKYLEEEMFLNVYVRHIDLTLEVCEIAKMELS